MSHVGFRSTNHPQQVAARAHGMPSLFEDDAESIDVTDVVDDRATPPEVFGPLHERWSFTIDVAAAPHNAKLPRYFDRETDGLKQSWAGERVWCNPPYSAIRPWLAKAWAEERAEIVVMLLPANRTEQGWWQEHVEPHRDRGGVLRTEFIAGRTRFIRPGRRRRRTERAPALRLRAADLGEADGSRRGRALLLRVAAGRCRMIRPATGGRVVIPPPIRQRHPLHAAAVRLLDRIRGAALGALAVVAIAVVAVVCVALYAVASVRAAWGGR